MICNEISSFFLQKQENIGSCYHRQSKKRENNLLHTDLSSLLETTMNTRQQSYSTTIETPAKSKVQDQSTQQHKKSGDERWDEILKTAESDAFLQRLSEQAHEDYRNGSTEEGGFDNQ